MWFRRKPRDFSRLADEGELMHSTSSICNFAIQEKNLWTALALAAAAAKDGKHLLQT